MGIKVRGIRQAQQNLNKLVNDIQGRRVVQALQSAMIIGSSQAALYTPIDTSTLINSQFREITENGMRITGRVGYSAKYAVYVNDPNIPQNFRRSTAQKEFLRLGFEDSIEAINAVMKKELTL